MAFYILGFNESAIPKYDRVLVIEEDHSESGKNIVSKS
jgi:hypothetical protein